MKTVNYVILAVFFIILASCATVTKFPVSPIVPAADGVAKIKKDKNNNYVIDLSITHLANPGRLNPPRKYYVVWMTTEQGNPINLGMLATNSKSKAFLRSVTSSRPTQIFVTTENAGNVNWPGPQELFRSKKLKLR